MSINWQAGGERVQSAARWSYIILAITVTTGFLAVSAWRGYSFARREGLSMGSPADLAMQIAQALLGWAIIWTAGYFVLKYLFRGLRWIGAGFAAPKA